MPLYEYECRSCGKRTEVLQRFADAPLAACPHCGGEVKKLFSAPAVQFKGTGWYVTDYAGKGKPGGGESKDKSDAAKEAGGEGKDKGGESKGGEVKADGGTKETAAGETKTAATTASSAPSSSGD
jgi:putative FmdB family regulatory protein